MTFAGEQISLDLRATNVYRKESGEWKMVHHHSDFDAAFGEKVAKMSA